MYILFYRVLHVSETFSYHLKTVYKKKKKTLITIIYLQHSSLSDEPSMLWSLFISKDAHVVQSSLARFSLNVPGIHGVHSWFTLLALYPWPGRQTLKNKLAVWIVLNYLFVILKSKRFQNIIVWKHTLIPPPPPNYHKDIEAHSMCIFITYSILCHWSFLQTAFPVLSGKLYS